MKALPLTEFGNPVLRSKSRAVLHSAVKKPAFRKLIAKMFFTMHHVAGIGLAAPQVGLPLQLAVIQVTGDRLSAEGRSSSGGRVAGKKKRKGQRTSGKIVIINPKIIWKSEEKTYDWEGCLSFIEARGLVPRHKKIKVHYMDERGAIRKRAVSGFLARVFQHEIDHLNGVLYVDRMDDMKSLMTLGEYKKRVLGD